MLEPRRPLRLRAPKCFFALVALAALAAAGCNDDGTTATTQTSGGGGQGGAGGGETGFKVRGSVEQIHVWKAAPSSKIEVHDKAGKTVAEGTTDDLGSIIFRKVPPADDYSVIATELNPPEVREPIKVTTIEKSLPEKSFYSDQKLVPGFNYITTRDGTRLSAYITLPGPIEDGPYPTVVNYSGYNPSEPGAPLGDYGALCDDLPTLCDAPTDGSALVAGLMSYATVGVNMRGTGCSGGAYDYFEPLQLLDGYDIIETVAAQDWVKGHRVGMTGLSYPGITQLFVARTHPPSLAAITPLSVIGNTYTTGRPGGIFNDGFALEWITNVVDKAAPYGQGWEQKRVDEGDKVCEENQLLHGQKVDVIQKAKDTPYYDDETAVPVDPTAFAHEIDIPVFMAGSFQDEQTGPFFFTLLNQFTGSPLFRGTVYNGVHIDGFAPQVLVEWKAFLDIYVAHEVPHVDPLVRSLAPFLFENVFKVKLTIPDDRFTEYTTWEDAKAAYEKEQPIRAIFENGGTADKLGGPVGTFDEHFDAWPPTVEERQFYFAPDGLLDTAAVTGTGLGSTFTLDPEAGKQGILADGGDVWDPLPAYDWKQPAPGSAVVVETAPLTEDLTMLGTGSVDLWIRSQVNDADLEVNLSEVRPDGQEMFVQSGWLRASMRALAGSATTLWPEHTYRERDVQMLVPGEWTQARVGIPAFSHVFRKGSKIRIAVDTPGGSRAAWRFANTEFPGTVTYDIGTDSVHASSVVLPVLGTAAAATPLPPCPSLRGQQCRAHAAYTNVPSTP